IIGGGAAGVEVALSLHHRLNTLDGHDICFDLIHRGDRIMPEFPVAAARHLMAELTRKGIDVHCGQAAQEVTASGVMLDDGGKIAADLVLMVTAGVAPEVIRASGLDCDDRGYIAVAPTLQSLSHPDVFAAGDVATVMTAPRPKAGVFAVRAGPVLTANLRNMVFEAPLTSWKPQRDYLALIGVGGGRALPIRGAIALPPSSWAWRLKEWIDRKFIAKFSELPDMDTAPPQPLARLMAAQDKTSSPRNDPALLPMRCLGCGAKTGWSDLNAAIRAAEAFLRAQGHDLPPSVDTTRDSARFNAPQGTLVQSVDAISALVDDPFLLGRIAALHALSDLFASHAKPHSALAILTLPAALAALQKEDITQLLAGAMLALHEHGAYLAGGHTSQADHMQVGFAVTGIDRGTEDNHPRDGDAVILTKPLGVGIIMAAHMKGHQAATGDMRNKALAVMATSNGDAAEVLASFGRLPMTDVTGFGLARHALSLLAGVGTGSMEFSASDIPVIDGAAMLAREGVESSLTATNAAAAPVFGQSALPLPLLHDPQTGGGLLAIVPQDKADAVLSALKETTPHAAIIGRYCDDGRARIRIS
ncbi:MAG: selenide, water dikinase SelD, partial [Alphaproteobacteria bacterium]|nr:selenide, water dikinase SelD [Alphaproteobacteria bacterium]